MFVFFNSASTVTLIINSHKIGWVRICGQVAELVIGDINGRTEPGEIVNKKRYGIKCHINELGFSR